MTITLTKPETAVVWRSTTPGNKTTGIPSSNFSNDGYELVIKTTQANGEVHTVQPTRGTIGGQDTFRMLDNGGSAHFLSDANYRDWVSVCTCTNTVLPPPHPPGFNQHTFLAFEHETDGGAGAATSTTPPGPILSSFSTAFTILPNTSIFVGPTGELPTRLIAFIYTECLPPPTAAAPAPSVTSVVDDQGLVWLPRSAHTALLPALTPNAVGRDQYIRFETWSADCTALVEGTIDNITVTLSGDSFVPFLKVIDMYNAGAWDADPGLPASLISTTGNLLPSFPLATRASQSMLFLVYTTPDRAPFPKIFLGGGIQLYPNPLFFEMISGRWAFFNLNQYMIFTINENSDGTIAASGSVTTVRQSTNTPPTWYDVGFGSAVVNRTYLITDTTGVHFFLCNHPGTTGSGEPTWNTGALGDNTTDGTVIWTYMGTSFFVAPWYTNLPSWTEPFIGGDHYISPGTSVTDSTRTYFFSIYVSSPANSRTGLVEPVWDTSAMFALTVDGTVIWVYGGLMSGFPTPNDGQELLVTLDAIDHI